MDCLLCNTVYHESNNAHKYEHDHRHKPAQATVYAQQIAFMVGVDFAVCCVIMVDCLLNLFQSVFMKFELIG